MANGHIDACHAASTGICTCAEESKRYLRLAKYSFSLFAIETLAGLFSGSLALISDAVHTLFDGAENILSAFISHKARFAKNEASLRKIGGYASAAIFAVISWFIVEEAFDRMHSPGTIPGYAAFFAGIALLVNIRMHRIHEEAPDEHRNVTHAWQKFHIIADIGGSIAALIGVSVAALGYGKADVFVSILIVVAIWIRIAHFLLANATERHGRPEHRH